MVKKIFHMSGISSSQYSWSFNNISTSMMLMSVSVHLSLNGAGFQPSTGIRYIYLSKPFPLQDILPPQEKMSDHSTNSWNNLT